MNENRSTIVHPARNVIDSEAFYSAAKPSLGFRAAVLATVLPAALLFLDVQTSQAGSAKWKLNPGSGDWNTATNWTPATVPNGSADIATFGPSNTNAVSLSATAEVNQILFNANASAYTITANPAFALTITGAGITNNSEIIQSLIARNGTNFGTISFRNSATAAGTSTMFTNNGGTSGAASGGLTEFLDTSSAGNGIFSNNGGLVSGAGGGGRTQFFNTSTAGNGNFTNKGGLVNGAEGGFTVFNDSATAGNGAFTNNGTLFQNAGGGYMLFYGSSTAANGVFTNNGSTIVTGLFNAGGHIFFNDTSTAGEGTFTTNGAAASGASRGFILFYDTSTAGNATFITNGSAINGASGGLTQFTNASTAANGAFINNGGVVSGTDGGSTAFIVKATAGQGTFTNNGGTVSGARGGLTLFAGNATAGQSTLINNGSTVSGGRGGRTVFDQNSVGNNTTLIAHGGSGGGFGGEILFKGNFAGVGLVTVLGNGRLDISFHNPPGVTVGSIEGDGDIFLGGNKLTVSNTTNFSGVIQDGGENGGAGGSLAIRGFTSLSSANTYTGGTIVGGRLLVTNTSGSATGSGPVTGSILGGTGTISGPVTVTSHGFLLGGDAVTASGSLTIANDLTIEIYASIQLVLGPSGAHSSLARTGGTWTFSNNHQNFVFLDLGAQPGVYDNIITGLAGDPGDLDSWVIGNEGFTGTFSYDGAGNIDLNLTVASGPVLKLSSAASQKTHGGAGNFNINLPLTGEPGVECRSGDGNYALRFIFTNNVVSGNASVTTGTGTVSGSPTFAGNTMIVNLTGVADVQKITVTLSNVKDSFDQVLPDKAVSVNMLIGDTTGNKRVNSNDIVQTKARSGGAVTSTTFRNDVNVSGSINASDIGLVKSRSGAGVP